jgi:ribosome-binding protein aMBF1 (putative translation factor)
MIANEVQRRVTQTAIREFEEALTRVDERNPELRPRLRRAMRAAIESQLVDLRQELSEYEALRAGQVRMLELDSLAQIPEALIRARIAAGLSQKELARRLRLKEQQVQRWEARRYAGASLERVQAVADALGVRIHERVLLPTAATAATATEVMEPGEVVEAAPTGGRSD